MKKVRVENSIFILARKSTRGKLLDYYVQFPNGAEEYLCTKNYSTECFEMCKAGIPINQVLCSRRRNPAVMKLVNYLNFMMPYFVDYFALKLVA